MIQIIPEKNDQSTLFKYIPNFLDQNNLKNITNYLKQINDWKSGISQNGTNIKRQQKWYQTNNHYFCKKWTDRFDRWKSHNYDDVLLNLQNLVQKECDNYLTDIAIPNINSILINYYKDGKDEIAFHKDNQVSFGEYPTICILSIGAKRTLHFQRTISNKLNRNLEQSYLNCEYPLENNSLFIMGGSAQKFWAHGIPIKNGETNSRWSLTFREYLV